MLKKNFVLGLVCLAFFGAGCLDRVLSLGKDTTTTGMTASTSSLAIAVDDTWKTFKSKSLDFTFYWPTRGAYVPTWEVKFYPEADARISEGCVTSDLTERAAPRSLSSVSQMSFCHTRYSEGAAGNFYLTDYLATKIGKQYVVISFSKHVYSAGALNCVFASEFPYSLSSTSCVPFKPSEYDALIEKIVSTFSLPPVKK